MSLETTPPHLPPDAPSDVPARSPRPPLLKMLREAPVTTALFAVCIMVFAAAQLTGDTESSDTLIQFGAVRRDLVWAGDYWRLVTSMFLHIGLLHIASNVLFGFGICAVAEKQLGPWRFLALYFGSGIVGAAVSVLGHRHVLSAGASGALFGVIGYLLVVLRLRAGSWRAFTANPGIRQQLIWIGSWFIIGVYAHFDNWAHGGGLLFGALYTWAIATGAAAEPRQRRARLAIALGVGALLVVASLHPWPFLGLGQAPPPTPA